ncbi:hypothetical protein J4Q44_G00297020 [Coregonus suidteri]|uniref:Uncharacterized protein n=1 Tax=Coregonus suidteri TaxID=861788 RepID=A0AAN8L2G5_9TELE
MGSSLSTRSTGSNCQESASGLVFFDPGRYEIVNRNLVKNNAHLAWRELSLLAP